MSLQKIQGRLQDAGALETIAHYLALLEDAYLVAALDKFSARPVRRRSAPPKLVTLNNALLVVVDPRGIPDPATEPARFGAWVENACLAYAWNAGQRVSYRREEPYEVDGVLEFTRRFPSYRPPVLCDAAGLRSAGRAGVAAMTWSDFLLAGPPGAAGRPRRT